MGNYTQVIEALKETVKQNPTNTEIWIELAFALEMNKDYDQAIDCYWIAISLEQNNYEAYSNLAYCYEIIGNYDCAIDCYKKTILLGYENSDNYSDLATSSLNKTIRHTRTNPEYYDNFSKNYC